MNKIQENPLYWLEDDYAKGFDPYNLKEDFWQKLIKAPHLRAVIINGKHYIHNGVSTDPAKWRGSGGKSFTIKMNDGTIIRTNDLWYQGEIPRYYTKLLPNNAEFI